ncbi:hypothetical protein [Lysobacter hankyongensis]|uniref:Uncharacterized protein n=1 Tax=Lysobacter hankyongensis TaxID=1176535 RepID=A0ABP9AMY1_9GAMM
MKTIRLYHPHTHEGIAYDPPPDGIELSVNDADAAVLEAWGLTTPPPALADAPTASDADALVADTAGSEATATEATPPRHDRRARVAVDLSSTEPAADTTARSA